MKALQPFEGVIDPGWPRAVRQVCMAERRGLARYAQPLG